MHKEAPHLVKEIIVLHESGKPYFHYHVSGERKLDELVSAFLSALGSMAVEVSSEQITVISFAATKFVWVRKGDLYFIALVSQHDSAEIYRVIMQDLAGKFVSSFYSNLRKSDPHPKTFKTFSRTVESTLQKFSGIPGLARRYHTALLPTEGLYGVKKCLANVEADPSVHRGAVLTPDGYIVISNLRAYELEDVLDLVEGPQKNVGEVGRTMSHPGLERNTSFFIVDVPNKAVCAFVVRADETDADLSNMTRNLVDHVRTTSFEGIKRVEPSRSEAPMAFYDHDVPQTIRPLSEIMSDLKAMFPDLDNRTFGHLKEVLGKLDGDTTISDVIELTGFTRTQTDEALAHLIAKGAIQIVRLYPKLGNRDKRFSAYLEVVGISTRDYKVLDTIWEHCTGNMSVKDISKATGISVSKILDVLRDLGSQVTWKKKAGASK